MKSHLDVSEAIILGEQIAEQNAVPAESGDETPAEFTERKEKRRYGNTIGLTKDTNPKLSNRLPRERGAIVAPIGDGLTPFERALIILGDRVKNKRTHYTLDGRACNATDLMRAAGVSV
jgi:hypothetical protein